MDQTFNAIDQNNVEIVTQVTETFSLDELNQTLAAAQTALSNLLEWYPQELAALQTAVNSAQANVDQATTVTTNFAVPVQPVINTSLQ
jgi:hypothetical protein